MNYLKVVLICCLLMRIIPLSAKVHVNPLFSDHMVLQQNSEVPIWGTSDQSSVKLVTSWNNKEYQVKPDRHGEWRINVMTPSAGGPFSIQIDDGSLLQIKDVLIGEVWLCTGQSNMEEPVKGFFGQPVYQSNEAILHSTDSLLHILTVARAASTIPQTDFKGSWSSAIPSTVADFSATGYFFGHLLRELLNVPVGLIDISYGGSCIQAWMSPKNSVAFNKTPVPAPGDTIKVRNRTPTALFNGMLNPAIGYGVKGCIWYQGETNYEEPGLYLKLFPTMVKEWRQLWGEGNFPFYYAQIAPFDYAVFHSKVPCDSCNSAYLREAQLKANALIPNSDMAVLMDVGEKESIHPMHKKIIGERLAVLALAETYGIKGFGYKSPSLKSMQVKGSLVFLSFDQENGLSSYGKELKNFEIAGEDKKFYPATALLRRKSVVLSSPNVENPVAVRYGFHDFVVGDLFGAYGLPVSSFRTDDW